MNFKKRFLLEKQNLTNVAVSVDTHGYHVNVPGVGAGVADWGGMTSWHEGKTVFVMKSGLLMRLLPKSAFNPSQLEELRSLLTTEIGPENIAREMAVN